MANNYFQFKEFIIYQDKCAMKVGTDGVLLGAWADCNYATQVLDIGTGTGLIALMLAQRSKANIDAVEIDESAFNQAVGNVKESKWNKRISIYHSSFKDYVKSCQKIYDLIVSNPPYFTNSLHTPDYKRTLARHNTSLPFSELFYGVSKIMKKGKFCLIIPIDAFSEIKTLASQTNFYLNKLLWIRPNARKGVKRVLLEFSKSKSETKEETIVIEKDRRHEYSNDYIYLTKDFYLDFNPILNFRK